MRENKLQKTEDFVEKGEGFVVDYFVGYIRISYFKDYHFKEEVFIEFDNILDYLKTIKFVRV